MISILHLDMIAIVDLNEENVVWALSDKWKWQHQPTLLKNGNILLFDNRGHDLFFNNLDHDPYSSVVEIQPFTG